MPVWATVVVGIVAGLGGGLIGTFVKVAEDRKVDVRRKTIEAMEDLAAMATDWFALANAAIDQVADYGPSEDSETRRRALESLHEGGKRLDRLAVLISPGHVVVGSGARVIHLLREAVRELPERLPEPETDQEDEEHMAALATEDDRLNYWAELQSEMLEEEILESRLMVSMALEGWDTFAEAAALTLQRGLLPRPRAVLAAFRRPVNWFKFKRFERRHRKRLAEAAAARKQGRASTLG